MRIFFMISSLLALLSINNVASAANIPKCSDEKASVCYGVKTFEDGEIYFGELRFAAQRNGTGLNIFLDGTVWNGNWRNNKFIDGQKWSVNSRNSIVRRAYYSFTEVQRKQIQKNLMDLGYYGGAIDGVYGRETLIAIGKYYVNHFKWSRSLNATTYRAIWQDLFDILSHTTGMTGYSKLPNAKVSTSTKVETNYSQNLFVKQHFMKLSSLQKKQLQFGLKKRGYYKSKVDGLYGPNTEKAVRSYAKANAIRNGYPHSVLRQLSKEVDLPNSFHSSRTASQAPKKKTAKKDCVSILSLVTGNDALCSKNNGRVIIKPPSTNGNGISNSPLQTASCRRDAQCNYGEICVKRSGYTSGTCMTKPSGVKRDWSPQSCTRDTQCGAGARCDRIYKICVER